MRLVDDLGTAVDARLDVALLDSGHELQVLIHSRGGGGRNTGYAECLALLLERLAQLDASLTEATVESGPAAGLPLEQRLIVAEGTTYPIELQQVPDVVMLARSIQRGQKEIAQEPGAQGGNTTKRMLLRASLPIAFDSAGVRAALRFASDAGESIRIDEPLVPTQTSPGGAGLDQVGRPDKEALADAVAAWIGYPKAKVSAGSSVEAALLQATVAFLGGDPGNNTKVERNLEYVLDLLGLTYDANWDTSETTASGGGGTVTARGYSRIRSALTGVPRCFVICTDEAPHASAWSHHNTIEWWFDSKTKGTLAFKDAGPGSRILFAQRSEATASSWLIWSSGRVRYLSGGYRQPPWVVTSDDAVEFEEPELLDQLQLSETPSGPSILEITFNAYQRLMAAALEAPATSNLSGPSTDRDPDVDDGAGQVYRQLLDQYASRLEVPAVSLPEPLPSGVLAPPIVTAPTYSATGSGLESNSPNLEFRAPKNTQKSKAIEKAAVLLATRGLEAAGWTFHSDRQADGVGYDLEFTCDGAQLHVEVKGVQGSNLTFNLSPKELWAAQNDPAWLLVVVTSALSAKGNRIHTFTRQEVLAGAFMVTGYRVALESSSSG